MPFAWIPISLTNFFNLSTLEREISEAEGLNGSCLTFLMPSDSSVGLCTGNNVIYSGIKSELQIQIHVSATNNYNLIHSLSHLCIFIFMYAKYSSTF